MSSCIHVFLCSCLLFFMPSCFHVLHDCLLSYSADVSLLALAFAHLYLHSSADIHVFFSSRNSSRDTSGSRILINTWDCLLCTSSNIQFLISSDWIPATCHLLDTWHLAKAYEHQDVPCHYNKGLSKTASEDCSDGNGNIPIISDW